LLPSIRANWLAEAVDGMDDNPPDHHFAVWPDGDVRVDGIGGLEPDLAPALVEALDGHLPVDLGYHDAAMPGGEGLVHDQQVAVLDAGLAHGIPLHAQKESGYAVTDQVLVQAQVAFDVVVCGRGEAGGDLGGEQGEDWGRHDRILQNDRSDNNHCRFFRRKRRSHLVIFSCQSRKVFIIR
jgi:hypothetical protein